MSTNNIRSFQEMLSTCEDVNEFIYESSRVHRVCVHVCVCVCACVCVCVRVCACGEHRAADSIKTYLCVLKLICCVCEITNPHT